MSTSVVFVHGTGVREEGYKNSFELIKQQLKATTNLPTAPCYWGTTTGAKLLGDGASIPNYDDTYGEEPSQKEQDLALWTILYVDPWYELRLIGDAKFEQASLPPGASRPNEVLDEFIRTYQPSDDTAALLREAYFWRHWERARNALLASTEYARAVESVGDNDTNHLLVLARAHVAKLMAIANDNYTPAIAGVLRDKLVEQLGTDFNAYTRGKVPWLLKPLVGLAKKWATSKLLKERGSISDQILGVPGDVILYQTRGQPIRDFIADAVELAPSDEVILLAHSLGGIAAVDWLVANDVSKVTKLITVGSQAPLMYELDCLTSLRYGKELPAHFPPWLNIYDRKDVLSYIGSGLFNTHVKDVEVDNGQPFPEAHSAYWSNPDVWAAVAAF